MRKIKIVKDKKEFEEQRLLEEKHFNKTYTSERFVLWIASQYENKGLSLSELLEVGKRGLKKAEIKTEGLKNLGRKKQQIVWFIRQEVTNELASIKLL